VRRTGRSVYLVLLIVLVGLALSSGTAHSRGRPPKGVAPDSLIVRLRANVDPQRFAARNRLRFGLGEIEQLPGQPIYLFQIADGTEPRQKAMGLARNPQVLYAEPNYIGQIPEARRRSSWVVGGDAEGYMAQWAPERMRLPAAHAISRGAGVTVAVLDTGVDLDHPALAGRLLPGYDFVGQDGDPREEPADGPDSAFGHGTHVAGLVALAAPDALILPLRTLSPDGSGDLWAQVQALQFAVASGANVVNLSFSFDERSQLFADSLADVTCTASGYAVCQNRGQVGAVIVAAAGNEGARRREWPAGYETPGLIAVGASTPNDRLADFSNYGSWVAIAAPGEGILSTVPGGGYATWSGTSMATPLLSGVVALVRSADGALPPSDVARRVVATASRIDGRVNRRVDAASALGAP
jgi:thermitase